jgi:hypothetical protein
MADKLRNSALMLSTASTETAHKGETTQVRVIRKNHKNKAQVQFEQAH